MTIIKSHYSRALNIMYEHYLKRSIKTLLLISCLISFSPMISNADDTTIYTGLDLTQCSDEESFRFIFIVDNSGSITSSEFSTIKATIDATAATVLTSDLGDVQIGVLQYGTNNTTRQHGYDVTVPFTNDLITATNWVRQFGTGSPRPNWFQDHLPGSLAEARRSNIYAPGNELDITNASNVQFVLFTDAARRTNGCCSMLVADSNDPFRGNSLLAFGEFDVLKNGSLLTNSDGVDINAEFTVLNVATGGSDAVSNGVQAALGASAAIASVGGDYTSTVEANANDPDGSQARPRRFISSSFDDPNLASRITSLVDEVIDEIRATNFTQTAPAVTVNAFNRLENRNELYYSLFSPEISPRWNGNVKRYELDFQVLPGGQEEQPVIVDTQGRPVLLDDSGPTDDGSIADRTTSFWSLNDYTECDIDIVGGVDVLDSCTPVSDVAKRRLAH